MRQKFNPRTGRVELIPAKRIKKPVRAAAPPPRPQRPVVIPSSEISESSAEKIGKIIADRICQALSGMPVSSAPTFSPARSHPEVAIDIDTSLIDVGIGEVADLKTGAESKTVGDKKTQSDKTLSSSQSRLRALKGRK